MDPEDRPRNFLPRKFDSLRQVRMDRSWDGRICVFVCRGRFYIYVCMCVYTYIGDCLYIYTYAYTCLVGLCISSTHQPPPRTPTQVCGYENFIKERFERCLDLYLCPRALRKTPQVDPDRYVEMYVGGWVPTRKPSSCRASLPCRLLTQLLPNTPTQRNTA